eukprot:359806-Chlamydomonas_euryale.AAC.1
MHQSGVGGCATVSLAGLPSVSKARRAIGLCGRTCQQSLLAGLPSVSKARRAISLCGRTCRQSLWQDCQQSL